MKTCSICGQEIQDAAIRCRHCKNWLVPPGTGEGSPSTAAPIVYSTTSGLAIASMVLGILWIYWIGSIVALVLGYLALREIRCASRERAWPSPESFSAGSAWLRC